MEIEPLHPWDLALPEASILQSILALQLRLTPLPALPRFVAGADVSYNRGSPRMYAAVIVYDRQTGRVVDRAHAVQDVTFPYIPGYLSFREGPPLIRAFAALEKPPEAVIFDGQGIAHPSHLGIAAHLGLWLQLPSVGCAKSRLVGTYQEPGNERGDRSPLIYHEEQVGTVLRTRTGVRPVFVSPGHLVDQKGAVDLILACLTRYRLPEPTRLAHLEVNALRRGNIAPI